MAIATNDTAALQAHTSAARAIVDSLDKSGKMKGHAKFAQMRAALDMLPR